MARCRSIHRSVLLLLLFESIAANAQRRVAGEPIFGSPNVQSSGCTAEDPTLPEEVRDEDFVAIERSACFGRCPSYTVTLHANGAVSWEGRSYVIQAGSATAQVPSDAARLLIGEFRKAGFWKLCAKYDRPVTDVPAALTTVRIGGVQKSVADRVDSAPQWLRELDYQVESLADTHRWIHGDPAVEEFRSLHSDSRGPKPGFTALMKAGASGEIEEIQKQLTSGANPNAQDGSGWTALMYATLAMKADAIAVLLRGGADAMIRSRVGQTALMAASLAFFVPGEKLELLLAAGADKETRDSENMSALDYLDRSARNWPSTRTEEYQRLRSLLK